MASIADRFRMAPPSEIKLPTARKTWNATMRTLATPSRRDDPGRKMKKPDADNEKTYVAVASHLGRIQLVTGLCSLLRSVVSVGLRCLKLLHPVVELLVLV